MATHPTPDFPRWFDKPILQVAWHVAWMKFSLWTCESLLQKSWTISLSLATPADCYESNALAHSQENAIFLRNAMVSSMVISVITPKENSHGCSCRQKSYHLCSGRVLHLIPCSHEWNILHIVRIIFLLFTLFGTEWLHFKANGASGYNFPLTTATNYFPFRRNNNIINTITLLDWRKLTRSKGVRRSYCQRPRLWKTVWYCWYENLGDPECGAD